MEYPAKCNMLTVFQNIQCTCILLQTFNIHVNIELNLKNVGYFLTADEAALIQQQIAALQAKLKQLNPQT